jgi:hypothetical protein
MSTKKNSDVTLELRKKRQVIGQKSILDKLSIENMIFWYSIYELVSAEAIS